MGGGNFLVAKIIFFIIATIPHSQVGTSPSFRIEQES